MSGGHLDKFKKGFTLYIVFAMLLFALVAGGLGYYLIFESSLDDIMSFGIIGSSAIVLAVLFGTLLSKKLVKPTDYLAQSIFHISPNEHLVAPPNLDKLSFGKELVSTLTRQVYDLATNTSQMSNQQSSSGLTQSELLDSIPAVVIGLSADNKVVYANARAVQDLALKTWKDIEIDSLVQFKFPVISLKDWIAQTQQKSINAANNWLKVEVASSDNSVKSYFDIAASYRQKHPSGIETVLVMFNHSDQYDEEESALSMIALSVHEIRTPLTILRGYIEVLHQELDGKVDPQTKTYIDRLSASSENLATFMSNILSVVRADQNQLKLQLQEADWKVHIQNIVANLNNRANVRGKEIVLTVADDLPTVAIDNISLNEVITNLVDNAIKYSPDDKKVIKVDVVKDNEGSVVTTVSDEGVGIPDSVVPNLFNRFYRNHRNQSQIAGTGLGLYLCKEIISAHHGNIWVKSKEGAGTSVSFSVMPFSRLSEAEKTGENGFTQVPHGWIKNHSMQRR